MPFDVIRMSRENFTLESYMAISKNDAECIQADKGKKKEIGTKSNFSIFRCH